MSEIPSNVGAAFIRQHHYSHGCHNGPTCFGLKDNRDRLVGVLAFATPNSENVRGSVFGPEYVDHVTELHRLVVLDSEPKNTESWLIAEALRQLKTRQPNIWAVVSFADATEGHVGTIYQATNAIYYGTSGEATFYLDTQGRLRHPRQCGVNISVEAAARRGWTPTKRAGKHRYLFLLPDNRAHKRELKKLMKVHPQPYPKALELHDEDLGTPIATEGGEQMTEEVNPQEPTNDEPNVDLNVEATQQEPEAETTDSAAEPEATATPEEPQA